MHLQREVVGQLLTTILLNIRHSERRESDNVATHARAPSAGPRAERKHGLVIDTTFFPEIVSKRTSVANTCSFVDTWICTWACSLPCRAGFSHAALMYHAFP
jgi:hypothetical protein